MKVIKKCLIIAAISNILFSGCSNGTSNQNYNELKEVQEEYSDGKKKSNLPSTMTWEEIRNCLNETSEFYMDFGSKYIPEHEDELNGGKGFAEIDGFADYVKDYFEMNEDIINYSGNVEENARDAFSHLKSMAEGSNELLLDLAREKDANKASELLNSRTQEMTSDVESIGASIPAIELNLNEDIEISDLVKIRFNKVEYTDNIDPKDTSSAYFHYEVSNSSNTYLAIQFNVENLGKTDINRLDDILTIIADYDGYEYQPMGSVIDESDDYISPYVSLKPLTEYTGWYAIEVPKKMQGKPVKLNIELAGNDYVLNYK